MSAPHPLEISAAPLLGTGLEQAGSAASAGALDLGDLGQTGEQFLQAGDAGQTWRQREAEAAAASDPGLAPANQGLLASDYPLWPLPAAASGSGAANDFITPANAPVPADMDPGLFPMGQPADHYASDGDLDRGFAALLPLPQSQHAVVCQPQASSAAALLAETASNGANSP
ncbi:hypothetical protein WJX84_007135 [Apatococcus fuscideae]|uniref:Uncharacterized protein n=1 Tax=Apatococcus fuscideae TaxID=2026836 RepID=A0AAW1SY72_9CHLO